MSTIKEVKVSSGCISCGTCEVVCPEVFYIKEISYVKDEIDIQQYVDCVKEAAQMCPVKAIEIVWSE